MKKKCLSLIFLSFIMMLIISSACFADDYWNDNLIYAASDSLGNGFYVIKNTLTMNRETEVFPAYIDFFVLHIPSKQGIEQIKEYHKNNKKASKVAYSFWHFYISDNYKYKISEIKFYDKNENFLFSEINPPIWEDLISGTIAEEIFQAIVDDRKQK